MRCPCSETGSQSTDTHINFRTQDDRPRVRIHGTTILGPPQSLVPWTPRPDAVSVLRQMKSQSSPRIRTQISGTKAHGSGCVSMAPPYWDHLNPWCHGHRGRLRCPCSDKWNPSPVHGYAHRFQGPRLTARVRIHGTTILGPPQSLVPWTPRPYAVSVLRDRIPVHGYAHQFQNSG
jgi:hypothetical protein